MFDFNRYMNSPNTNEIEMHFLPQFEIFKIIDETNCICTEMREDTMVGDEKNMLSNTFLIQKKGGL